MNFLIDNTILLPEIQLLYSLGLFFDIGFLLFYIILRVEEIFLVGFLILGWFIGNS
jgi:hypothetical protein